MSIESGLRQRIRSRLRSEFAPLGGRVYGQPADAYTGAGRTDLYVLFRGRYVGLEIKTESGKATVQQLLSITDIRKAGCHAWIVRSPQQAVAAVWAAQRGVPVAGDFDFGDLFKEPDESKPGPVGSWPEEQALSGDAEISAFLTEPEVAAAVETNGQVLGNDGAAIEPAADYDLRALYIRMEGLENALHDVNNTLAAILLTLRPADTATSAEVADLLAEPEDQAQQAELQEQAAAARPTRSRRRG